MKRIIPLIALLFVAQQSWADEPKQLIDVAYGSHPRQVLDFYQAKSDKPTPVVFYIHGGGYAVVGDRVYVTLGTDAPLSALDAATGETVRTYENTKVTEEILRDDGVLLLSVAAEGQPLRSDPNKTYANMAEIRAHVTNPLWTESPRTVMAVDAESGKVLWKNGSEVASMSLAADQNADATLATANQTIHHGGTTATRIILPQVLNPEAQERARTD
jgi:glucose dehydrogenase